MRPAFYEYGRLHGAVRLRWRFLDERIPVPWVGRDEPTLHELQKSARAMKVPLEVRGQRNRHQRSRRAASAAVRKIGPMKGGFALRAYQPFAWRVYPPAAAP